MISHGLTDRLEGLACFDVDREALTKRPTSAGEKPHHRSSLSPSRMSTDPTSPAAAVLGVGEAGIAEAIIS